MGAHDYLAQGVATMRTSAHRRTDQQYQECIFKPVYSFDFFCLIVFVIGRNKTWNRRLSQSSPYYIAHDVCCGIKYEKRYSVQ